MCIRKNQPVVKLKRLGKLLTFPTLPSRDIIYEITIHDERNIFSTINP